MNMAKVSYQQGNWTSWSFVAVPYERYKSISQTYSKRRSQFPSNLFFLKNYDYRASIPLSHFSKLFKSFLRQCSDNILSQEGNYPPIKNIGLHAPDD